MKTPAEIIRDGREYMMSKGWAQGKFGQKYNGTPVCMMGSVDFRAKSWFRHLPEKDRFNHERAVDFMERAISQYRKDARRYSVANFNDHQAKNFNEVNEVMLIAEKLAEEDESA